MKRYLLPLALGAVVFLAPSLAHAQEKPVLNTAPTVPTPAPVQPAPAVPAPIIADTARLRPTNTQPQPAAAPAGTLPTPSYNSPSGFELPEREQKRQALQQHAEMYSKVFIYSGISPGYSSYYGYSQLSLGISPAIGYRLTDRIAVGPGLTYTYNNYGFDTNINTTQHISTNTLGFKVFGQVMVYKQFFAHAEYETTKAEIPTADANGNLSTASYQVNSMLAGAGYRSQISNRVAADILLLYNFNDNYNALYHNPVVRFNFLFNIGH
jgi:hypothetical protein